MSDYDIVEEETADDGTPFRAILRADSEAHAANPRENDAHVGVMFCLRDNRYIVPEEGDLKWDLEDAIQDRKFQVTARWLRVFHGATVVLPLGHRGISVGTPGDDDDPGNYFGVIYDTPETRKVTGCAAEDIRAALEGEVDEYRAWAEGEVFGAIVQCANVDEDGDVDWDHPAADDNVDSVWGLIGRDRAETEARRMLDETVRQYETDNCPAE